MKKAIFLFDYTGIMAQPWLEAGYECWCFDAQHPEGITRDGNHVKVGMWFSNEVTGDISLEDVDKVIDMVGSGVEFVFGFPECTHLAVSGAAWFAKKRDENPFFQEEAMVLVHLTRRVAEKLNVKWAFENPVSVISTLWRKPDYSFHPWEYGGYLPLNDVHPIYPEYIKPRDAYPKKTCIWAGNGFKMPEKKPVDVLPGYSDQHKKLGGSSTKTKNIRSATPRGFANAVYEANGSLNETKAD